MARSLSNNVVLRALPAYQIPLVGLISYSSCTGFAPGPTIGHYIADTLGRNDIEMCNLSSQGCEAAFPGLRRCYDYSKLTGKLSLAVACELSSLSYWPENPCPDPENDFEVLRANAIFGDGCSCAVIGFDDDPHHPEIIDFYSVVDTRYIDKLGYVWRDGRLRVRLSKDVPDIAVNLAYKSVMGLLAKHNLDVQDVSYWIFHPPGAAVLDKLQQLLELTDEHMQYSRDALQEWGNCSSSTVGIVGKLLMEQVAEPHGWAVMVNVGPGMVSNSVLLSFKE